MALQLIRGLSDLSRQYQGCVVTIGNFDGVHRGHQVLLAKVKAEAELRNAPAIVVTFEPQPGEFFARGKSSTPRLMRWREKFHALARCDIDAVLVLRFDEKLAAFSAEHFVKNILSEGLGAQHVIVGDDFRFGQGRAGDFEFLQAAGKQHGFTAENMTSVIVNGERVSSTRVRQALQQGEHVLAQTLLGRPYCMEGRVVYGDKRGRTIGFPTANIYLHRDVSPVSGVYSVRMHGISATALPGVANVGTRPTVDGARTLLEVHLFDFNQDIYKRHVTVEFCEKLRDEKRFDSFELLKEQIWLDAAKARDYFKIQL